MSRSRARTSVNRRRITTESSTTSTRILFTGSALNESIATGKGTTAEVT
jgi:hypothetical protein